MRSRRQKPTIAFEVTISILDFVTICLGATLLLVVMVPNRTASVASIATHQEALELVRSFFARDTLQSNVYLSEDLVASHPALAPPRKLAPSEYEGRRLSTLNETQRVRRVEMLVELDAGKALQEYALTIALQIFQQRGIGYVTTRPFSSTGSTSGPALTLGHVLSATTSPRDLIGGSLRSAPVSAAIVLQAAVDARSTSPTPAEPTIVVVTSAEGLRALAGALGSIACPDAGLFLIGPPMTDAIVMQLRAVMSQCARVDYLVVSE
jgi:hypothetical protein